MILGYEEEELKRLNAFYTAKEIAQQPRLWKETYELIRKQQDKIKLFLKKTIDANTRIIFVGAGTSDYVGDTIRSHIEACTGCRVDAIATTDIVASPGEVLHKDVKTVLVSFARSGNSPESIGAYRILQENMKDISHVVITCNKNGDLAKEAQENKNNFIMLLPDETNDKGFAMTSSFSCMMLAALLFFDIHRLEENREYVEAMVQQGEKILNETWKQMKELSDGKPKRVVYLGTGCLKGVAQELALKNMELTNGKIATMQESVLGFRHGPKTFMDNHTYVIILMSQNEYTNQYNKDLIKEIYSDTGAHKLIVLSYQKESEIEKNCDYYIFAEGKKIPEIYMTFSYTLFGQIFALFNSIDLGIEADNPSPSGSVNRVVKGVILHNFINTDTEKSQE